MKKWQKTTIKKYSRQKTSNKNEFCWHCLLLPSNRKDLDISQSWCVGNMWYPIKVG